MKRLVPKREGIDESANRVTRRSSESEDIDLAAEATEAAPAKTLARQSAGGEGSPPGKSKPKVSSPKSRR